MLKLALMHDLVEIYAGDTFTYDKEHKKTQEERELNAAHKLFSQLPEDLHKEFHALFEEYELTQTTESKIVKSFDKMQAVFQNLCSQGVSWKKHGITYDQVDENKRKHMEHNPFIMQLYERIMNNAKERKLL